MEECLIKAISVGWDNLVQDEKVAIAQLVATIRQIKEDK